MSTPFLGSRTALAAKGSLLEPLGESAHRLGLVAAPHGVADREEIGPRLDQRRAIRRRDPSDRHAGYFHQAAPPLEELEFRVVLARLGLAREEGAERDIV